MNVAEAETIQVAVSKLNLKVNCKPTPVTLPPLIVLYSGVVLNIWTAHTRAHRGKLHTYHNICTWKQIKHTGMHINVHAISMYDV